MTQTQIQGDLPVKFTLLKCKCSKFLQNNYVINGPAAKHLLPRIGWGPMRQQQNYHLNKVKDGTTYKFITILN